MIYPPFLSQGTASCAADDVDPEWWFPEIRYGKSVGSAAFTRARKVCSGCELLNPCAAWAIATGQEFGIWGGLSPRQIRRHRRRASR